MDDIEIIRLNNENIHNFGLGCIKNSKHPGFRAKAEWFNKMTGKGLVILSAVQANKSAGFIEYIPAENSYKPINGSNIFVIHCIWVYPKKYQNAGTASKLIASCVDDAEKQGKDGVAVLTSKGTWMPDNRVFFKNGFEECGNKGRFSLLYKQIKAGGCRPSLINTVITGYEGLNILYSDQCPMNFKFVNEITEYCRENSIKINLIHLKNSEDIKKNPSPFGVFCIIYNNKIAADNPVSLTRFKNIINKG